MEPIKVLVSIPEMKGRQEFLDEMAAVSSRFDIEYRTFATREEVSAALKDVEIIYTFRCPSNLKYANRLKWVALHYSGMDHDIFRPVFDPDKQIIVTNVAGAHAVPIAEYCITVMCILARNFLQLFRDKMSKTRDPKHSPPVELCGQTVGIVGYGQVGRELARLARCCHMRVLALKKNPLQRRSTGYQWQGVGDPDGSLPEKFFGPGELFELLAESDFVVNMLPNTTETRGLFDINAFRAMKPDAYLINVGRGPTVDIDQLAKALRDKVIAGASMDAFETDPNPLPKDNPLWDLDNVFITPHISGTRRNYQYLQRTNELFCENLRRYLNGQPLFNVVSRNRGY
jgi:phosphoglycerate dehydrogenase-like enzyme